MTKYRINEYINRDSISTFSVEEHISLWLWEPLYARKPITFPVAYNTKEEAMKSIQIWEEYKKKPKARIIRHEVEV